MYFDINNYKGNYAMHCKTEEEAKSFLRHLRNLGRTWLSGEEYTERTLWSSHKEKTVYVFNNGTFTDTKYAILQKYTILEWEDFMKHTFTKADLKTGDVIKLRDGRVGIVNRDFEMAILKDHWFELENINQDLTSRCYSENDIIAVRRPMDKSDCRFSAFEYRASGTLVYEREEPVEMTLAEVCKLLGKNIKIIK